MSRQFHSVNLTLLIAAQYYPVGKIAEEAVCRSVTIWHCILSVYMDLQNIECLRVTVTQNKNSFKN